MGKTVLLLNSTYEPLGVISWYKAVVLTYRSKATVVETYDDFPITTVNFSFDCPAVVVLNKYAHTRNRDIAFSRSNVFSRDHYTCQYCGSQPGPNNLTLDHVIPRSKNGSTSWDNITTACVRCNAKKADKNLEDAGLILKSMPKKPDSFSSVIKTQQGGILPNEWRGYIRS